MKIVVNSKKFEDYLFKIEETFCFENNWIDNYSYVIYSLCDEKLIIDNSEYLLIPEKNNIEIEGKILKKSIVTTRRILKELSSQPVTININDDYRFEILYAIA